jgi:putative phosphoesterase
MRVAALYDVHGMPWALEAVLAELGTDADEIVFGGDFFGGPYDAETVELVRSLDATCIRGNADELDEWGRTLPLSVEIDGVTYCHATPTDNKPITTAVTPDDIVRAAFGDSGTFVIGHTHHQFDLRLGDLRVINAGSVGMAYEGEVAAFWTMIDDGEPTFRKTPFDVERAVHKIRSTAWENAQAFVDENLLLPVSRDAAIAYFEGRRA